MNVHMHYCCWPCVCDVQDFVKVDTYTAGSSNRSVSSLTSAPSSGFMCSLGGNGLKLS